MTQETFSPFGTVSSRREFRQHASLARRQRIEASADELQALVSLAQGFDIGEDVFFLAWELLSLQGDLQGGAQRAALLFALAVVIHMQRGSTCLPLAANGPLPELLHALIPQDYAQDQQWQADAIYDQIMALIHAGSLGALIGTVEQYKPLILEGESIFPQRLLFYENRLVETLCTRWFGQKPSIDTKGVDRAMADLILTPAMGQHGPIALTSEQQYAILTSVHQPWTWITGGPGTGKTSIIVSILRLAVRLGVNRIALAAPTGKAANRMAESIDGQLRNLRQPDAVDRQLLDDFPTPQTIHRLLGYVHQSGRYQHHEHNPIDAKLVIIDEASMIDLFLMEHLLRAIDHKTHIVFLGDADQLPSVDAGAVFRDLVAKYPQTQTPWARWVDPPMAPPAQPTSEAMAPYTVRLSKSYRMREDNVHGRRILKAAQAVRTGQVAGLFERGESALKTLSGAIEAQYQAIEYLPVDVDPDDLNTQRQLLQSMLTQWFESHIRPPDGFGAFLQKPLTSFDAHMFTDDEERERIRRLFEHMQRAKVLCLTRVFLTGTTYVNELFLEMLRVETGQSRQPFLPGLPVMMLRNDYDKGIFNGDQGLILPVLVQDMVEWMAVFPHEDNYHAFALDALKKHLSAAFAMTVHKSQGSEFKHVALILPTKPIPLLTRELLYTGMTRGSDSVLLWGPRVSLEHGVLTPERRFGVVKQRFEASIEPMS